MVEDRLPWTEGRVQASQKSTHSPPGTSFCVCHSLLQNFPFQKPPEFLTNAVSLSALFDLERLHHRRPRMPTNRVISGQPEPS